MGSISEIVEQSIFDVSSERTSGRPKDARHFFPLKLTRFLDSLILDPVRSPDQPLAVPQACFKQLFVQQRKLSQPSPTCTTPNSQIKGLTGPSLTREAEKKQGKLGRSLAAVAQKKTWDFHRTLKSKKKWDIFPQKSSCMWIGGILTNNRKKPSLSVQQTNK